MGKNKSTPLGIRPPDPQNYHMPVVRIQRVEVGVGGLFFSTDRSVQSTPADNTRKRVWQYIEKERKKDPIEVLVCLKCEWNQMTFDHRHITTYLYQICD